MENETYIEHRAQLLERTLKAHLNRRFSVELGGAYTEGVNGPSIFVHRIDERFLAAEQRIVDSLVSDLIATGPEGAERAYAIVAAALDADVKQRAKFDEQPAQRRG